jgi:hypothetical protein
MTAATAGGTSRIVSDIVEIYSKIPAYPLEESDE